MERNKSVEEYISKHAKHKAELEMLRSIALSMNMDETVKWGAPVYTASGKNIVGLGSFKSYVGLWFYQGALLKDETGKMINAQEGVTQAMRQWRFESLQAIDKEKTLIKTYINEAIINAITGKEIKPQKKALVIPVELQNALDQDDELKLKFESFNLTRKRECAEYVGTPKREATRQDKLEKLIPMILEGISPNDKYRK